MDSEKKPLIDQKAFIFFIYSISILGIVCSVAILFPPIQKLIIQFAEQYLIHRKVNYYDNWMSTLFSWAKGCIALIVILDFFVLTKPGKKIFADIRTEIKQCLSKIDFSSFHKPFLFAVIVYLLGLISLIRSDVLYVDDVDRALRGFHGWNEWSRHLADILSTFIHADTNLADISPLPQLLAILLMAASTVLLVQILCGKITYKTLLASIPLGLSPYFLENFSYKFDAPYMGLSVVACIIPFLFIEGKKAFIFTSIVSLLVMCTSYQASSGIYVLIAIMIIFNDWNTKRKSLRELLSFFGIAAASYCAALILFRLVFMVSGIRGHGVATSMLSPGAFFPGILTNLRSYALTINHDFGLIWKIGIALICLLFVLNAGKRSNQQGISRYCAPVLVLLLSFTVSYGAYIALERPLLSPRAFIGFGTFLAIICICLVSYGAKTALIGVLALNWCFFVFAFSYGNALADQKRYTNFRVESLLRDLSALFPDRKPSDPVIQLQNNIGYGPYTENIARHYPVIKELVSTNRTYQIYKYMNGYFHWTEGKPLTEDLPELPVLLNSYYHVIRSDGKHIIVEFKN